MKRAITNFVIVATITLSVVSVTATPLHESPRYWTAAVNGADAHNEQYGPFKSQQKAAEFCHHIPTMYTCKATPILPPAEWARKGAR